MLTRVINLFDEKVATYPLSPKEAVVAAYEEYENHNTSLYPLFENHPEAHEGQFTVACGDWVALKEE